MSLFMIETNSVSAAKSSMDSIASQITNIGSTVQGYDTSCDDFDFASAKSAIVNNIEAFSTKVKNTGAVMESVVNAHTALQSSLKFNDKAKEKEEKPKDDGAKDDGSKSSPRYSSPGGSTPSTEPAQTAPVQITEKITKIAHDVVDPTKLTDSAKKLFESVTYSDLGYAMYAGMFVIACSEAVGKVGEIIEITLTDGSKVRCIVGQNLETAGEIHFLVNDKWKEDAEGNITNDFVNKISSMSNYGTSIGSAGIVDLTNLPAIGQYTTSLDTLGDKWNVTSTKASVESYAASVRGRVSQNVKDEYSDACLSFAETYAYALYTGNTGDSAERASNYPHSSAFTEWYSDSKEDTLKMIYSQVVQGKPVVIQVNGNVEGTSRHFVTVVGLRSSVTDVNALTEDDLLIIDSWDGKLERMDQEKSRFLTTGAQCHKKDYSGYYLRILK